MKRIAIIDLDKVVADSSARFARATRPDGKLNWKIALDPALVELDVPVPGASETIDTCVEDGWNILYLTGRPEKMRYATAEWLANHHIFLTNLIMRPNGDFSPAHEFKLREIEKIVAEHTPNALLVVDDLFEDHPGLLSHIACARCFHSLEALKERGVSNEPSRE